MKDYERDREFLERVAPRPDKLADYRDQRYRRPLDPEKAKEQLRAEQANDSVI